MLPCAIYRQKRINFQLFPFPVFVFFIFPYARIVVNSRIYTPEQVGRPAKSSIIYRYIFDVFDQFHETFFADFQPMKTYDCIYQIFNGMHSTLRHVGWTFSIFYKLPEKDFLLVGLVIGKMFLMLLLSSLIHILDKILDR